MGQKHIIGKVTSQGLEFTYIEDQTNDNRFICMVCNSRREECLYCHDTSDSPVSNAYHNQIHKFYYNLAKLIADNYNAATNTWANQVTYDGIEYTVSTGYPRRFTP